MMWFLFFHTADNKMSSARSSYATTVSSFCSSRSCQSNTHKSQLRGSEAKGTFLIYLWDHLPSFQRQKKLWQHMRKSLWHHWWLNKRDILGFQLNLEKSKTYLALLAQKLKTKFNLLLKSYINKVHEMKCITNSLCRSEKSAPQFFLHSHVRSCRHNHKIK